MLVFKFDCDQAYQNRADPIPTENIAVKCNERFNDGHAFDVNEKTVKNMTSWTAYALTPD